MSTTTTVPAVAASARPLNPVALRIAYWGLVPFIVGTGLVWLIGDRDLEQHVFVTTALSSYAALVISFLGGIYWGLAARQPDGPSRPFVIGIVPSVVAWIGVLMPPYSGLVVHGVMLVAGYLVDRRFYPQLGVAAWLTPRFRLSAVAALCCFLAAAGS
ncbi:DUF3429 domain-containing protein [Paucibacter sp. R3-3]|uniref:DUF3429 domain-containing protein n=1 Tax=Roseateles agri TaxID=3098619 RepID=A0ABU5DDE7_9BURK|nr:DUF3429 domain-containing protein [Paucibacter sp. R3-3]MDY0744295.1 DUF3429 domain-containing protein [Paucibacter sp. R3-3]